MPRRPRRLRPLRARLNADPAVRYAQLKAMADPDGKASPNEQSIARRLMKRLEDKHGKKALEGTSRAAATSPYAPPPPAWEDEVYVWGAGDESEEERIFREFMEQQARRTPEEVAADEAYEAEFTAQHKREEAEKMRRLRSLPARESSRLAAMEAIQSDFSSGLRSFKGDGSPGVLTAAGTRAHALLSTLPWLHLHQIEKWMTGMDLALGRAVKVYYRRGLRDWGKRLTAAERAWVEQQHAARKRRIDVGEVDPRVSDWTALVADLALAADRERMGRAKRKPAPKAARPRRPARPARPARQTRAKAPSGGDLEASYDAYRSNWRDSPRLVKRFNKGKPPPYR